MRRYTYLLSAGLLALGFLHAPANATVLATYQNDLAGFTLVTSNLTTVDFSSIVGNNTYASYSTSSGVAISGATFKGVLGSGYSLYANSIVGGSDDYGSGAKLIGPEYWPNSYLSILLPSSITAFGIEVMSSLPQAASFAFTVDGVPLAPVVTAQNNPNRTFFGFTSDAPMSEIQIRLISGTPYLTYPMFDNAVFGMAGVPGGGEEEVPSETPEVTTLLYMGMGIAMIVFAKYSQSGGFSVEA